MAPSRPPSDFANGHSACAASFAQQSPACCRQFAATQRRDDGVLQISKDADEIRTAVSAKHLPLVYSQEGTIKNCLVDVITLPVAVPKHVCEGFVTLILIPFQQQLSDLILGGRLCRPKSAQ